MVDRCGTTDNKWLKFQGFTIVEKEHRKWRICDDNVITYGFDKVGIIRYFHFTTITFQFSSIFRYIVPYLQVPRIIQYYYFNLYHRPGRWTHESCFKANHDRDERSAPSFYLWWRLMLWIAWSVQREALKACKIYGSLLCNIPDEDATKVLYQMNTMAGPCIWRLYNPFLEPISYLKWIYLYS